MQDESVTDGPADDKSAAAPKLPVELMTVLAFGLAIFGVVATGSAIAAAIREPSPWLFAAAYGGPAALAFGLYWAIAQRL
ncbi:MAG: hypothetical protein JO127_04890 [Caulobacteraceae bacterium]|nr:hypothetical protein [Caulobacteraceae bacterium]